MKNDWIWNINFSSILENPLSVHSRFKAMIVPNLRMNSNSSVSKVSNYFRFLIKILHFPLKLDEHEQILRFQPMSFPALVVFLKLIILQILQWISMSLIVGLSVWWNFVTNIFHEMDATDSISLLSTWIIGGLMSILFWIFIKNSGSP